MGFATTSLDAGKARPTNGRFVDTPKKAGFKACFLAQMCQLTRQSINVD
jgi:hypothetical protein